LPTFSNFNLGGVFVYDGAMTSNIRLASRADLQRIDEIYDHYVHHSTCTYQEEASELAQAERWFDDHDPRHPITVAETDGVIVGWGSLSPFKPRSAYRFTVENSLYVDRAFHRRGIGSTLLADQIERAKACEHHCIIAAIDADQQASIALHQKFGFEQVAHLREVGFKFARWLDVIYMQRML